MVRIRRFGIVRTANVVAAMYIAAILIVGIPVALIIALAGVNTQFGTAGGVFVIVSVLFFALLYAVVGWIATASGIALYNLVAGRVGGIEMELQNVTPPAPPPAWGPVGATPPAAGLHATSPGG